MGLENVFEQFPILETERFYLRKLTTEDAPEMFSYFSQDDVTKYYNLESFTHRQQAIDLIEKFNLGFIERRQIRWGAELKETGRVAGTCGFHAIDAKNFKAEIGYELHPDYWGKGIMPEIVKEIVAFGFEKMDFNRIEAMYDPRNEQSGKVLIKSGFQYEGTLRKRYFEKGQFVDAAIASIIKIP
ncbi:GNAT family N-acetyltransferase [Mesobacillus thioparans]|uniref:GNAT family N-acetyltransferase n=1 Tax=Mesobacillus thioparans TaxID=370439 RepID=UPI0039F033EE